MYQKLTLALEDIVMYKVKFEIYRSKGTLSFVTLGLTQNVKLW